jgi:hypothetical protein
MQTQKKLSVMLLSGHQSAGQNWDIERVKRLFGNVAQFRYLGRTVEEIRRRQEFR